MAVAARTRRPPFTDRLLGTSRRRRQAGYLALGTAYRILLPTLRRLAIAATVALAAATLFALWVFVRVTS